MKPAVWVLRGRLAEALGHDRERRATTGRRSFARPAAAAEATLLDVMLRQKPRRSASQMPADLETLAMTGAATPSGADDAMLATSMRTAATARRSRRCGTATRLEPNPKSRGRARTWRRHCLAALSQPKGEDLPPIEALECFSSFATDADRAARRRMIRRPPTGWSRSSARSGRQLLQYQIDSGSRARRARRSPARLAMVYLTHRNPIAPLPSLRSTRIADLPANAPAAALAGSACPSDVGRTIWRRHHFHLSGRERSGAVGHLLGFAQMARVAEQIELYYADRWRDFKRQFGGEGDVIRAGVDTRWPRMPSGCRASAKIRPLMSGEADRSRSRPEQAGRRLGRGIRPDRQDAAGVIRSTVSARDEGALSGCHRPAPSAGNRRPDPSRPAPCRDRRLSGSAPRANATPVLSTDASQNGNLRSANQNAGGRVIMSKPTKTEAELIAMARAELSSRRCPDGIMTR